MSYNYNYDLEKNISRLQRTWYTILGTFKIKVEKSTSLKHYKVMAVPTLLYYRRLWMCKEISRNILRLEKQNISVQ